MLLTPTWFPGPRSRSHHVEPCGGECAAPAHRVDEDAELPPGDELGTREPQPQRDLPAPGETGADRVRVVTRHDRADLASGEQHEPVLALTVEGADAQARGVLQLDAGRHRRDS